MNYAMNSKHRKLNHRINMILNRLSFNFFHLSLGSRIVATGVLITAAGLFCDWFQINDTWYTAFQGTMGYIGFTIMIILAVILFLLLSHQSKENIKSKMHMGFHDYTMVLFAGVLIFLLTLTVVFNAIAGYSTFSAHITPANGSIFAIIG